MGCPDWDKLQIASSKHQLEFGALGLTAATILPGKLQTAEKVVLLAGEKLLDHNPNEFSEIECVLNISEDDVRGIKNITRPWVRKGPRCPSDLHIVEGPVNAGLSKPGIQRVKVRAATLSTSNLLLPPGPGVVSISNRSSPTHGKRRTKRSSIELAGMCLNSRSPKPFQTFGKAFTFPALFPLLSLLSPLLIL